MIQYIRVPKLGQTMEEATVERWHKKEGDPVAKGDVVLEITTDKATLEVESFVTGTVRKILAPEGVVLPVNTVIAIVGEPDDALPDDLPALEAAAKGEAAPTPPPVAEKEEVAPAPSEPQPAVADGGRLRASPRARRLAAREKVPLSILRGSGPGGRVVEKDVLAYLERRRSVKLTPAAKVAAMERGVDVTRITGTGPGGRITRDDVLAATPAAAAPVAQRIELTAMRRIVAERMTRSKREAPHFYIVTEVDMTGAVALRRKLNAGGKVRIGFHDLLIRAAARAMSEHPAMNARWADGAIERRDEINIGLAVALDEGLIVPVVRNADRLSLADTARASAALIEKARSKRLTPDEYEGGCLTISNLGMYDVESFLAVINPGEPAIIGVGRIADKPVVIDGGIHVRSMMNLSLSADHRVVDGAIAAAFLKRVKELLEAPEQLT